MSKTPLFRLVRRSLRLAQASLHDPRSVSEMIDEETSRAFSRRDFLRSAAVAGSVAAMAGCAPSSSLLTTASASDEVVILGGGIAGLTAGYRLRQAGIPIRILEGQSRTGGRMFSIRDYFADGQVAELGGELIDTGHEAIRNLATELGIELDDLSTDDPALTKDLFFFDGALRSETEVVTAFRPVAAAIERDLATIGGDGDVTAEAPNGAEPLDRISVAQWLDRNGVSGWLRELLTIAYTTEYGLETEAQSALNLLTMISLEDDVFKIFGDSDERFHVRGGNDLIVGELANRLRDAIELDTRVEAITERPDGSFSIGVQKGRSARTIHAQHVLVALPFTTLRLVQLNVEMPAAKRAAIEQLGYGTNAKLMTGFSEKIWRTRHQSNGSTLTDLPYQLTWETSRLQPGTAGILTNFTGGRHGIELGEGTAAHQASLLTAQLEKIYPGIGQLRRGMKEVRFHWPTNPWVRGSYASYGVGQWTGFRGLEGQRVRRMHFAGEHCSLESQGFMNGGCETGEAAAREILSDMGKATASAPRLAIAV